MTEAAPLTKHRVGVIGATGRLGRVIVRDLRAAGADVLTISRGLTGSTKPAIALDGLDQQALTRALSTATAVINAGPTQLAAPIAAAKPQGAPLIAVGSLRRLLPAGHEGRDEAIAAESAVRAVGGVMLHAALLYGDGGDPITRWLQRWRAVPAPSRRIQPIHLDDAAQCFVAALQRWPLAITAIDLVGPTAIRQWQAYRQIAGTPLLVPVPLMLLTPFQRWLPEVDRQAFDQIGDPQPMRDHLGIRPRPFQP